MSGQVTPRSPPCRYHRHACAKRFEDHNGIALAVCWKDKKISRGVRVPFFCAINWPDKTDFLRKIQLLDFVLEFNRVVKFVATRNKEYPVPKRVPQFMQWF